MKTKKAFNPLVSVIVNCYNGQDFLKKCIKSIIDQSYKNWEIVFFDNNSTDKSKEILKNFKDKRIKYFKSKKFLKLYKARNLAIAKAKGKYLTFLDTDDWWVKNKLSKQVSLIGESKEKNINFIYSNVYIYNQKTKKKELYIKSKLQSGKITQNLLRDYKIGILTVMMKKKLFKNNKFNEKYEIIGDFDFFSRLSLDTSFYAIQQPLAYYRSHESNATKKKINTYIMELKKWIKENKLKFKNNKINLEYPKKVLFKLRLKKLLKSIYMGV
jgi:glycosyltransferase involved in cell wall biosynthesis